jgi:hypothetical protein
MEVPKASMNLALVAMEASGSFFCLPCQKFANKKMSRSSLVGFPPPYRKSGGSASFHEGTPLERNFANTHW